MEPGGCLTVKNGLHGNSRGSSTSSSSAAGTIMTILVFVFLSSGLIFAGSWLLWRRYLVHKLISWRKILFFWRKNNDDDDDDQQQQDQDQEQPEEVNTDDNDDDADDRHALRHQQVLFKSTPFNRNTIFQDLCLVLLNW